MKIGTAIKESLGNTIPVSVCESHVSFERFLFLAEPVLSIFVKNPMTRIGSEIPVRRRNRMAYVDPLGLGEGL